MTMPQTPSLRIEREQFEVAIELARQDMRYRLEVEGLAPALSLRTINDYIDSLRDHLRAETAAETGKEQL
jgi:hypothetical protein